MNQKFVGPVSSRKETRGVNIASLSLCDIPALPCIMNRILFMFWHQKLKFLEYETLHCWKSRDFEFHIFCLYLENVWINALKYSFIEILNVLFNSKFCREENILTPASSLGSVKNYLANITQIYCEEENCFHTQSQPVTLASEFTPPDQRCSIKSNFARGKMSGKFGKSIKLINSFQKLNKQNRSSEFVWRINFQEQKL